MGLDNPIHIAFLLIVLLLVFGARRLPEMGRSLGSGIGFWWLVGGSGPNRCAALTDCLGGRWGGDAIDFVVRYFDGLFV